MEDCKKKGEIALACEFLGALGLSVLSTMDRLRTGLIVKFYKTYKDKRDELRDVFNKTMKEANEFLTVRISDEELGFNGKMPSITEEYIEELHRNPQLLDKYFSAENPKPKDFIPILKFHRYVKDPNGEKGYHEVIYNEIWIKYIFPEKNFALLDFDLRDEIYEVSPCAAIFYEEACKYKFRFDSAKKFFEMDENKVRLKLGFDRYVKENELDDNDETYVLKSKGYTKSSDIFNKILKDKVQKVLKVFYDENDLPFFIEIEKVKPEKRAKKESTHTIGRPKNTKIPKYRFWVRFNEIKDAEAVEIKDGVNTGIDISNELYLFRITLGEILRVNGCDDKVATSFSQKIADEVKERSATDTELAYKVRKKIEELPRLYEGKKVHDIFKLVQKVLWEYKKLGEDPTSKSRKNAKSKDADQPDLFWPSDIEGQIGVLKHNYQRISEIMNDCKVSPEHFDKMISDFKNRLSKPDKSGSQSMKTEEEAWSYLNNWLKSSASNYEHTIIEDKQKWIYTWNNCLQAVINSLDEGLSMAFQLMYFQSFAEDEKLINIVVPAYAVRDYILIYASLRFNYFIKTYFGEGVKAEITQKWSPGNGNTIKKFEDFYDHVKNYRDTKEIKWKDCQSEISTVDKIFTEKVKFESYDDKTHILLLQLVGKETHQILETNYVNYMNDIFRLFYGDNVILNYRVINCINNEK